MENKNKQNKKFAKGFTLLELLVVVLIIGILAAIALPKYKMAVARTKFATLKSITKTIAQAKQRYYLINGSISDVTIQKLDIQIPSEIQCSVDSFSYGLDVKCDKEIFGKKVSYYHKSSTDLPRFCVAFSTNKNDIANKLCQQETGKTANNTPCNNTDGYCTYYY